MRQPLISIITVVYNNREGIEQTLNSVLNQTYPALEYIVLDGGSTDGTKEIIESYRSRLSNYISGPDNGIYDAMNKGISMAKGELIGMINSGDFYENDCVSRVVEAYLQAPDAAVYHGMLRIFSAEGTFSSVLGNSSSFLHKGMIEHPTCFVKKSVYNEYGSYSLDFRSSADYEFMLRIAKQNVKFHFIEAILANFYMGGMSSGPRALLETLKIRHNYGLISTAKRLLFENFLKLRYKLRS